MQDGDFRAQLQASLGAAYTLERELGGGGMSRVFVATETALERRVVIKVLPPDMAQGVSIQRFTREIRLAAQLQHAHIVPLLHSGEMDGLPWYTMPFVEGRSLRAKLEHGGELPIPDAIRTLREIATALAYAHGRGVVHRDMKPENVLLSEGTALVADFGVAKALVEAGDAAGVDLTSRGVALGTPAYMAPEQGMADPRTDQRADVYAFGVMAYEILAGRTPFAGRSPQATLAAHVTETPEPVDRLRSATPPALAALVMQCLAKSPADRPQSAGELVHALDALATHTATTLSPAPGTPALSATAPARPASQRRPRVMVLASLALLAGAAGGWFSWRQLSAKGIREGRIAVAPFRNETGDAQFDVLGRYTADVLARELSRDTSMDVASMTAVAAAMSGLSADLNRIDRLRKALKAAIVIDGSIFVKGDSLSLQASVTDSRTGKPLWAIDAATALKSSPTDAVETLRERVLGAFEVDRTGWFKERAPKLAAYRELARALEIWSKDYAATRAALHRAIALDSTLFIAYDGLATTFWNERTYDSVEAVTNILSRFRNQFSPEEREIFEYRLATDAGDFERAMAVSLRRAKRDPTGVPRYSVGLNAIKALHARQAIAALEQSDSTMTARFAPRFQVWQLAMAYHIGSQYERELTMLQRKRAIFPDDAVLFALQLTAFAGLQRATEAEAVVDTLLRGTTDPNDLVIRFVAQAAQEFEAHGDSLAAKRIAARVLDWSTAHPTATPRYWRTWAQETCWLVVDSLHALTKDFANSGARSLEAAADSVDLAGFHGLAMARLRDSTRARALADSLGALNQKWLFGHHTYWRAAIYGELGNREAAVRLLRQAYQQGYSKELWHSDVALRALRGYPPFEALIKPQG